MKFKNQTVLLKYSLHSNPRSMNSFHFRHKPSSKGPVEILNSGVLNVIDCLFFMFSLRNPQTPVGWGAKSPSVTPSNGASVIQCASSIFMFIKVRFELTKNGNVKNDNADEIRIFPREVWIFPGKSGFCTLVQDLVLHLWIQLVQCQTHQISKQC